MDKCAEFTPRIAALAQSAVPGATHPERWYLLPDISELSWDETREYLSRAPKPICVAPLSEPGYVGVWSKAPAMPKHVEDQVGFYREKISLMGLKDEDALILGTPAGEFAWTVGEFRKWSTEYAVLAKVVLSGTTDPRVAQILILGPEQNKPPINPYRPLPPPAECGCGHDHEGLAHG